MTIRLGVNLDHVATLRQARREVEPDPVAAARVCKTSGADIIVIHLRQDRRHIQDEDLAKLRKLVKTDLHLEMASTSEMVRVALKVRPDSVCIVPESPQEVTTQGGLRLENSALRQLGKAIGQLRRAKIGVSLFIDPDPASVRKASKLGADTVELCTSQYALAKGKHLQMEELERLELAGYLAHELQMHLHAGHGLDYHNVTPVAKISHLEALNIGFSIVARSVFVGLRSAVAEMKRLIAA